MTRQDVREKIPNNAATLPSQLIQEIPRRLALASDSRPDHRPQHKPKRGGGTKIHTTSTELQTDGRSDRHTRDREYRTEGQIYRDVGDRHDESGHANKSRNWTQIDRRIFKENRLRPT